jgi:hypothetical protein
MANETQTTSKVFDVEKCRAKGKGMSALVDCLSPEQAYLCGYSLSFGSGFFCNHPLRKEFIKNTERLQNKTFFPPSV